MVHSTFDALLKSQSFLSAGNNDEYFLRLSQHC